MWRRVRATYSTLFSVGWVGRYFRLSRPTLCFLSVENNHVVRLPKLLSVKYYYIKRLVARLGSTLRREGGRSGRRCQFPVRPTFRGPNCQERVCCLLTNGKASRVPKG